MITVRFASGFSVQYNDLTDLKWQDGSVFLYRTKESTNWSVCVPKEALVECTAPCRTYNPTAADPAKVSEVVASVARLAKDVRSLKREVAKWKRVN